ncbi:MAG: 2-oxo acid dehydrogenase subunit E2 [Candidatus Omnitrophica bacterium]|nr:2-oxo acid dehydrogenase subunit E2 [Candidatus Omnitrophota bacterium]
MIHEIIMPKLGETMEEGYINKWLKNEGDIVKKGEVILEVMSDKTNFEVESQYDGFLRKILVQPSDKPIPVTTVIGYIADSMDEEVPIEKGQEKAGIKPEKEKIEEKTTIQSEKPHVEKRIIASPAARRLAQELGIKLEEVKGTGEGGRIEKKDVENYAAIQSKTRSEFETEQLSPVRKIIAEKLLWSKQNIPHYYLSTKILMNNIERLKEIMKAEGKDFTYTDFIVFFVSRVLKNFQLLNSAYVNGEVRRYDSVDIGLAVNTNNGLVVPVIREASKKNMEEISKLRNELVEKARSGQLKKDDVENCRFVITNLGMFGVTQFQAIINPPGTAIMAVGSIEKEPVIIGENITIGKIMWVSLSLDHRVVDGAYGGAFLQRLKMVMENPGLQLL